MDVRLICGAASVAVPAFAALVTACGGPATSTSATDTSTPAPVSTMSAPNTTSTSPVDAAKNQAVATYVGMWRTYADAATTSDWQSPKLAEYATGAALSTMSRGLYADHYKGLVSRGEPVNHPVVSSAEPAESPTKIVISDCGDSTNWTKHRADNGEPADDEPGGRRQIGAIVVKQSNGMWKVSDFGVQEVGSC